MFLKQFTVLFQLRSHMRSQRAKKLSGNTCFAFSTLAQYGRNWPSRCRHPPGSASQSRPGRQPSAGMPAAVRWHTVGLSSVIKMPSSPVRETGGKDSRQELVSCNVQEAQLLGWLTVNPQVPPPRKLSLGPGGAEPPGCIPRPLGRDTCAIHSCPQPARDSTVRALAGPLHPR